ncbi:hypothetical protein [Streptomyces sp. NPDC051173]|uniref:hypothetical protein n=1 Tax=Streptomyces sp. NPDC051173 TaxID=3155164 RepID=UPI0034507AF9
MNLNLFAGRGRHRAVDELNRLREENLALLTRQAAADDFFALLAADRNEVHRLWQLAEHKASDAGIVASCLSGKLDALESELLVTRAALANATKVTVGCGERDIEAGDEATQPVPTGTFWADPARWRALSGPTVVVPLAHSPQATGDADTTQKIPLGQLPVRARI